MKRIIRSGTIFGTAILSVVFVLGLLLMQLPRTVLANPDLESLWAEGNTVSCGQLALTSSGNADGSGTGTWADANGKWAKKTFEFWTFTMEDSAVGAGTINSVTLYLKHYQSGWDNDSFNIDVYDGSTWSTVQSYSSGSGPPTGDTTDNLVVTDSEGFRRNPVI